MIDRCIDILVDWLSSPHLQIDWMIASMMSPHRNPLHESISQAVDDHGVNPINQAIQYYPTTCQQINPDGSINPEFSQFMNQLIDAYKYRSRSVIEAINESNIQTDNQWTENEDLFLTAEIRWLIYQWAQSTNELKPVIQTINQSIVQLINQCVESVNLSYQQSLNQSNEPWVHQEFKASDNEALMEAINLSINQAFNQAIDQVIRCVYYIPDEFWQRLCFSPSSNNSILQSNNQSKPQTITRSVSGPFAHRDWRDVRNRWWSYRCELLNQSLHQSIDESIFQSIASIVAENMVMNKMINQSIYVPFDQPVTQTTD